MLGDFRMAAKIYRFGDFELDLAKHQLRRISSVNEIEPQVFKLLILLVENRDRVVTKDEIIEKIWDGRAISDAAVTSRIRSARAASGDDGRTQRWIKTRHGVGFRCVGDVTIIESTREDGNDPLQPGQISALLVQSDAVEAQSGRADVSLFGRPVFKIAGAFAVSAILLFVGFAVFSPKDTLQSAETKRAGHIEPPSIAILPYEDFTGTEESAYYAVSLAERTLNRLAVRPNMSVRSRRSSAAVVERNSMTTAEVGALLNVDFILEGGLNIDDDRILLTNRLVDVSTDTTLWSKEFDRPLQTAALIAIETNLMDAVSETLGLQQDTNPDLEWSTQSAPAYEAMALGDYHAGRPRTLAEIDAAIAAYTDAIDADGDLAAAYASRATQRVIKTYAVDTVFEDERLIIPARQDIERAKALDPDDIRTRFADALLKTRFGYNESADVALFDGVLDAAPYFIPTYEWYAEAAFYSDLPPRKALEILDDGLALDPLNPNLLGQKVYALFMLGEIETAVELGRKNYQWNPEFPNALEFYTMAMEEAGFYDEAYAVLKSAPAIGPVEGWAAEARLNWVLALDGPEAAEVLATIDLSRLYYAMAIRDRDEALGIIAQMPDTLTAVSYLPFLEAFDEMRNYFDAQGLLDRPVSDFAFDREDPRIIEAQEEFMDALLLSMTLNETGHPSADALSQVLKADLDYMRKSEVLELSVPYHIAGWLVTEGRYREAVSWLEYSATVDALPSAVHLQLPLFDRIRDREDFKRVEAQYAQNVAATLARYEARVAATR